MALALLETFAFGIGLIGFLWLLARGIVLFIYWQQGQDFTDEFSDSDCRTASLANDVRDATGGKGFAGGGAVEATRRSTQQLGIQTKQTNSTHSNQPANFAGRMDY